MKIQDAKFAQIATEKFDDVRVVLDGENDLLSCLHFKQLLAWLACQPLLLQTERALAAGKTTPAHKYIGHSTVATTIIFHLGKKPTSNTN